MSLQELEFTHKTFLNKTTVIYGGSGAGKSTIIGDILYQIRPFVDQILVISPTDPSNHTYSGKTSRNRMVPLPCIHYKITEKLLDDVWARQEALASVYDSANNLETLARLFNRLSLSDVNGIISDVQRRKKEREAEIIQQGTNTAAIEEMEKDYAKLLALIYKHYINKEKGKLAAQNLTKEEQFALKYLNLNPNLVVVFDDCTDQLDKFKKHDVIQKIAFQGRHVYMTTIIACHSDKKLDSSFKINTFISLFAESSCATLYFKRDSLGNDSEMRRIAKEACNTAFTPLAKYQKLAHVREENKFYRFTATKREPFRVGSPLLWDYCEKIQSNGQSMAYNNKYAGNFLQ